MNLRGARVSLRLAFRLVRRSPARSILIATLVAIPVLAGTFALVTISTARLSPGEAANRFHAELDLTTPRDGYVVARVDGDKSLFPVVGDGKTFTVVRGSPGGDDYHYLWINPKNPERMIAAVASASPPLSGGS